MNKLLLNGDISWLSYHRLLHEKQRQSLRITFVTNVYEAAKFHDQYNKF